MRAATTELKTFLASNQFVTADLVTIEPLTVSAIRVTNADLPLNWGGQTFLSDYIIVEGLRYRVTTGLETDEQTIELTASRDMTIDGVPVMDAIREGVFDAARINRMRAYIPNWNAAPEIDSGIVGTLELFSGYISKIPTIGRTVAEITVKSDLALLDVEMPRRRYQAGCLNTLFDSGCTLSKAAHTTSGTAGVDATKTFVPWSGSEADTYSQGTVLFTSGANSGLTRNIKESTVTGLVLSYPLPEAPAEGDGFEATKGCDKTKATCTSRFDNLDNFVGFPFIPATEKAF